MTKKYSPVTNEQRRMLVKLIYEDGLSIRQAAITSKIYYPTAKAINKIYVAEKRIDKRQHRFRKIAQKGGQPGDQADGAADTMLRPIREELEFGHEIYESLDDEMIDVTFDRIEEARRQTQPFDHFKIQQMTNGCKSSTPLKTATERAATRLTLLTKTQGEVRN